MAGSASVHDGSGAHRHQGRQTTSWIVGSALIVLGVAFLLENAHYITLTANWWAIFLYLAAVACFTNAWRSYRAKGGFGPSSTGSLIWGLVFAVVATIFIFNLLWDTWWPAILIAVGLGIVVGYVFRVPGEERDDEKIE